MAAAGRQRVSRYFTPLQHGGGAENKYDVDDNADDDLGAHVPAFVLLLFPPGSCGGTHRAIWPIARRKATMTTIMITP